MQAMIDEPTDVYCANAFASITSLVPDWAVTSRVTVLTTTRLGGVSEAPYDSLNLGLHVNDNPEHVLQNRQRLQESFALPEAPRWLNQTHSADIIRLESSPESSSAAHADGSWTDQSNIVAAVLTADCLPVVISDVHGTQVAVVHAGWRGLAGGILENALSVFPSGAEVHAWLGPAIGPSAFEVGEDVLESFTARHAKHDSEFVKTAAPGKYLANLYGLARSELQLARDVTVSGGDYCTYDQANWFHSHRRDGVKSGRMATIAWISDV